MPSFLLTILVLFTSFLHGQGQASPKKAQSSVPRFEYFKVSTPLPKRATEAFLYWPDEPDETGAHFEGRIREAAKQAPDIAGLYAVVRVGCGSDCNNLWIVDVKSGDRLTVPFQGATRCVPFTDGPLFSYRMDSRLLIVTGSLAISDGKSSFRGGPCGRFYYVVDSRELKLIRSIVRTREPNLK